MPSDAVTSAVTFIARISNKNYTASSTISVSGTQAAPATTQPTTPSGPEQGEQAVPITGQATADNGGGITGLITGNPTVLGGIAAILVAIIAFVGWKMMKGRGKRGNPREIKTSGKISGRA